MFFNRKNLALFVMGIIFFNSAAEGTCYRCEQIRENNRKNATKEITYYDDHIEKIDKEKDDENIKKEANDQ